MRAWAKVCALLVLVLAMAVAVEAEEKERGICPDDKKTCQVGNRSAASPRPGRRSRRRSPPTRGSLRGRLLLTKAQILQSLGEVEASTEVLREAIPDAGSAPQAHRLG